MFFTKTVFFTILNEIWEVWGCPGGRGGTIRRDSLELWQGLVLQDMGEVDFHVFFGNIGNSLHHKVEEKSEDQYAGPRTNLEVFGDEVSLQYFPKT